ncbi:hypothetical protein C0J52_10029 [Blattella germanica]|nr:hypothetical protein C0J52_10029 [Blattella germanica]
MSPLCSLEGFKEIGSKIRKSFSSNHSQQDNFSMPNGSTSSPPPLEKLDEISEDISDQRKATDELFEMYKDVIKKFSLISGKLTEIKDEVNELGSLVRGREKKEISDLDINLQKANLQNSKPRSSISWRHTIQHDSFDRMTPFCMNIVNEDGEEEEICKLSSVIRFQKQNKTFYYKPDSNEDDDSDEYSDNEINEEDLEMETLIMKNDKFSDYQSVKNEMFAMTDDSNIHDEPAEEEYISKTRNMSLAAVLENMINEMETNSENIEETSNLSEQHDGSNDSESIKSFTYPESMRTIMANTSLYGKDNVGFQSSKTLPLQESVVKADAKTEKQNLPINMLAQKRSSATSMKTLTSRNIESGNRIAIRTLSDMNEYPDMSSPKRGNFLEVESSLEEESLEDFDITHRSVINNELLLKCNALLLTKSKSSLKNDNIFKKEDSQLEKNTMQLKNMSKYYEEKKAGQVQETNETIRKFSRVGAHLLASRLETVAERVNVKQQ